MAGTLWASGAGPPARNPLPANFRCKRTHIHALARAWGARLIPLAPPASCVIWDEVRLKSLGNLNTAVTQKREKGEEARCQAELTGGSLAPGSWVLVENGSFEREKWSNFDIPQFNNSASPSASAVFIVLPEVRAMREP